ncbi:tRNA (adenosine(37)-N6)-dimethylallyltransferase MiaA [Asticcacaulis sp. 201]|uniref:tRNA (adenosine(37)-N6)-dimethylallyltransferase MiaA n=1 Tax=Asticcacaulis sp. 201 TaxID=3028787 RepID=UPI002916213E|nr:tRNA (adenosine(37)-N6)-dimethylallyltransferase MiaA [Asticcacaulis sp. 201]MDV6332559.1 tRNA (adenosine(37)-N6)-dimethylallyltransferase MiaA [Asticcacaulis sp. 201]
MPEFDRPIYLLAGPTASGKSAKALDWAERTGGAILNADSMQLYTDVPILTARPDANDMARAPHHLYGHLAPQAQWSAGDWLRAARPHIADALNGGPPLCIVGGTGLYFNSLIFGLAEIPDIADDVRAAARLAYSEMGEAKLRDVLKAHDPQSEARIMPNDQQRLARAYEVWLQTGQSLSDWQARTTPELPQDSYVLDILQPDRDWLYERCDRRLRLMLDQGALDEVRALVAKGLEPSWPIMRVLGLAECVAYLNGDMPLDEALTLAQQKTRNYAKRQSTWFRNQF